MGRIGRVALKHIHICKMDTQWKFVIWHRELSPVLCDNLEGQDVVGSGREVQEGVCIPMVDLY